MFEQDHPSIVDEVGIHSLVGSGDREVAKVGDTCRGRRTRTCRYQKCLQIKGFEHLPCSLLYQATLDSAATSLPPTSSDLALLGTPTLTAVAMADLRTTTSCELNSSISSTNPYWQRDNYEIDLKDAVTAKLSVRNLLQSHNRTRARFVSTMLCKNILPPSAGLLNRIYEDALSDCVLAHPAFQYPTSMMYEPDSSMHDLPLACRQLCQETHLLVSSSLSHVYKYGLFDIRRSERGDIRVVYHAA
ncbi:hypothetical protein PSPO01_02281 [Paraphaeosphaeria sporulosa]